MDYWALKGIESVELFHSADKRIANLIAQGSARDSINQSISGLAITLNQSLLNSETKNAILLQNLNATQKRLFELTDDRNELERKYNDVRFKYRRERKRKWAWIITGAGAGIIAGILISQ